MPDISARGRVSRPAGSRPSATRPSAGRASPSRPSAADRTAEVADRLHSAAIHLLRRLRREDDASGLPAPQLSALSVVVFGGGPITMSALAAAEQVRVPTISRVVSTLEEKGLIEREADAADGRVVRIKPTPRGSRILHEGRQRRVASLIASLADLPAKDRAILARALPILEKV